MQRPARTGAPADGSRGSAAEPGGSRPQGGSARVGGELWEQCCGGRGGGQAAAASRDREWRLAVEALAEFAQAGQAWASVEGFDVVDEVGDAR